MTHLVVCDGAKVPRGLANVDANPLHLSSSHSSGAPNIRIPSLPHKLRGAVPNVAIDLLRIAAFVYWTDQMVVLCGKPGPDEVGPALRSALAVPRPPHRSDCRGLDERWWPLERLLAESYVRLMRTVERCSPSELMARFVELTDCAYDGPNGSPGDVERIVEMIRRQADTARFAIEEMTKPLLTELVSGRYPTTCLVRLALAGTPDRKRKDWRLPGCPLVELTAEEEKAFGEHRFQSRLPVVITGERVKSASNVVELGGRRVEIRDADFVLLLRQNQFSVTKLGAPEQQVDELLCSNGRRWAKTRPKSSRPASTSAGVTRRPVEVHQFPFRLSQGRLQILPPGCVADPC